MKRKKVDTRTATNSCRPGFKKADNRIASLQLQTQNKMQFNWL